MNKWTRDRKPINGELVLLFCERDNGYRYICIGAYSDGTINEIDFGMSLSDFSDELEADEMAGDDVYYVPLGYYEHFENGDNIVWSEIVDDVVGWMPLPSTEV